MVSCICKALECITRIYSKKIYSPELWKQLSLNILGKDETLVIIETLVADKSYASEEERAIKFEELTGKKRATYFNLKKKLKNSTVEKVDEE